MNEAYDFDTETWGRHSGRLSGIFSDIEAKENTIYVEVGLQD